MNLNQAVRTVAAFLIVWFLSPLLSSTFNVAGNLLGFSSDYLYAEVQSDNYSDNYSGQEPQTPLQYPRRKIIVKFNDSLAESVPTFTSNQKLPAVFPSSNLSKLITKYKVNMVRPVFRTSQEDKAIMAAYGNLSVQSMKSFYAAKQNRNTQKYAPSAMTASVKKPDLYHIYEFDFPADQNVNAVLTDFRNDPNVEYAQPAVKVKTNMTPNDPFFSSSGSWGQPYRDLWGLVNINAPVAWDTTQGEGVIVAVVDTGVDYNHEDLAENIWTNPGEIPDNGIDDDGNGYIDDVRGWDGTTCSGFVDSVCTQPKLEDNDPMDGYGHGTHVAGTIAAVGNNNAGVIGVAPKAQIMVLKGLNDSGEGEDSDLARLLVYAVDNGAAVINNSWGGYGDSPVISDAIDYAHAQGAVILAAAGNDTAEITFHFPANLPNVITVGASDQNDHNCFFSNYGTKLDVAAPGGGTDDSTVFNVLSVLAPNSFMSTVYSSWIVGSKYIILGGTSMATPHVSGLAALILSSHPNFNNEDVRQALRVSAEDVMDPGFDELTGYGRINAKNAVEVDSVLRVDITAPAFGSVITENSTVAVTGSAYGPGFISYHLSYTKKGEPLNWVPIGTGVTTPVTNGSLGAWNLAGLKVGNYFLKVTAMNNEGLTFEKIVPLHLEPVLTPIVTNGATQTYPDISKNYVVWQDDRNGNWDIYLYDLIQKQEMQITSSSADQMYPSIYGDKIVWQDNRNGNWDIYLFDLNTKSEQPVNTDPGDQVNPNIDGKNIVWDNGTDIYLFNLDTNITQTLPHVQSLATQPDISGNRIVWMGAESAFAFNLFVYDMATQSVRQITSSQGVTNLTPSISGNYIVWQAQYQIQPGWNYDVDLYDLTTNTLRAISSEPALTYRSPAVVSGNLVTWRDDHGGNGDIFLYDIASNVKKQITSHPSLQQLPALSDNKLVWHDERNGNADIYFFDAATEFPPDQTPPTGSVNINDNAAYTVSENIFLNLSAQDADSGMDLGGQMQFSDDGTNWLAPEGYATGKYYTLPGADGVKTVYVKFKDYAGNWSAVYSDSIILDRAAPVLTKVSPQSVLSAGTTQAQISITTNENAVCKYSPVPDMSYDSMNLFSSTGGTTHNQTITGLTNDSAYNYYVQCRDNAGNRNYPYFLVNFSVGLSQKITPDRITVASNTVVKLNFSVPNDAIATKLFMYCPAGLRIDMEGTYRDICNSDQNLSLPANNKIELQFRPVNSTDVVLQAVPNFYIYKAPNPNYAYGVSGEITVTPNPDHTPPTGSILINNGAATTSAARVLLLLQAADTGGNNPAVLRMRLSDDGINWDNPIAMSASNIRALAGANGTKTVYAQYQDAAGNWSTTYSDSITWSFSTKIRIKGSNPDGDVYVTSTNVSLLLAPPGSATKVKISNDDVNHWSGELNFNSTMNRTLSSGDGAKSVYIIFKIGGAWTAPYMATTILDTLPPNGSILINNGAPSTPSPNVTLTLSASDQGTGIGMMKIANDPNTLNSAPEEPFASQKAWTLSAGQGFKTVYVRFKDLSGKWSAIVSRQIIYN